MCRYRIIYDIFPVAGKYIQESPKPQLNRNKIIIKKYYKIRHKKKKFIYNAKNVINAKIIKKNAKTKKKCAQGI